jgi:hypothetical protein
LIASLVPDTTEQGDEKVRNMVLDRRSKMTTYVKFCIGKSWVCLESGFSADADRVSEVTLAIREQDAFGQPASRVVQSCTIEKSALRDIAFAMLEIAARLAPRDTSGESFQDGSEHDRDPLLTFADHFRRVRSSPRTSTGSAQRTDRI